MNDPRPLIAHVLYRLDTGGMEQMLVTVINHTQARYRHAVICLDGFSGFRRKIADPAVACLALHKRPGKDPACYVRLWKTLRSLRPDLVQTYNVGALDATLIAKLAGVHRVVHAERGRDASDPNGENRKYRRLRRWLTPCIDRYLAVSRNLASWLTDQVGINRARVIHIPNGIDITRYTVATAAARQRPLLGSFAPPGSIVIGTVGRLDPVKDQTSLIAAFQLLCESLPTARQRLRLVIAGKGSQQPALEALIQRFGLANQVRLLGNRDDVPELLPEFDVFALSSIAEGMPGVLLEAMATGLPVVATAVGGVAEVVSPEITGLLVPAAQPAAMAQALATYVADKMLRVRHGQAGRQRAMAEFSLDGMLSAYVSLYDGLLGTTAPNAAPRLGNKLTQFGKH